MATQPPPNPQLLEHLAQLADAYNLNSKRMFGGVCFLDRGNMVAGINGNELVLRLGRNLADEAILQPHVRYCDFTGRPLKTMVMIAPTAALDLADITQWLQLALSFTQTLPSK